MTIEQRGFSIQALSVTVWVSFSSLPGLSFPPFLHSSRCSCLKLRGEQLVIEDHCLSSGPQDFQCLSLQLICARQYFCPFVCILSSSFPPLFVHFWCSFPLPPLLAPFPHKLCKPFEIGFSFEMDQEHPLCLCRLPPINFPLSFLFFTLFQPVPSSDSSCELSSFSPARTGAPFSRQMDLKKETLQFGRSPLLSANSGKKSCDGVRSVFCCELKLGTFKENSNLQM